MPANRETQSKLNGAKSKGPTSEAGRAKCSEAAKTAAAKRRTANSTTLPGESWEAFEESRQALHAYFEPANVLEVQLVDEVASLNWIIRREYFGRTQELVLAYDDASKRAVLGTTQSDLVAAAELHGASETSRQASFDRSIGCQVLIRNRVVNMLLKLKRHAKNGPRVLPPLETQDLSRHPQDPSVLDTGHGTETVPPAEPVQPAASKLEVPTTGEPVETTADTPQEPQDILAWAKTSFGFEADDHQSQLMTDTTGRTLVLGARQTGKSTAAALKVLYTAIHNPGRQILLAAPSNRQSGQIKEKARAAAHRLFGKRVKSIAEGFELPNGAQILALPDSEPTVRGFSNPVLIVVDEAAFVSDQIFKALLPAQATGQANVILLSTPNGQQGFFFEQWADPKSKWTRIQIDVRDCARINAEWLAEARLLLGEDGFQQEFHCEFLQAPGAVLPGDIMRNCLRSHVEPLFEFDEQIMP